MPGVLVRAPASCACACDCACEFFSAHGELLQLRELVRVICNILLLLKSGHLGVPERVRNILLLLNIKHLGELKFFVIFYYYSKISVKEFSKG